MDVHEAIVALRKALGETQQGLATRLRISVSAVHKYETGRIPEPAQLLRLKELAEDEKQEELKIFFRDLFYREVGNPDKLKGAADLEPRNGEEKVLVAALLTTLRNRARFREERVEVIRALTRPAQELEENIDNIHARREFTRTLRAAFKHAAEQGYGEWDEEKGRYTIYHKDRLPPHWKVHYPREEPELLEQLKELDKRNKEIERKREEEEK